MKNLAGKRFGRLTPTHIVSNSPTVWECKCDCGVIKQVPISNLSSGHTKSCGCLKLELAKERTKKRPFEWLYTQVRNRKKWVDLTYEEFLGFTKINECHYCNLPIQWHIHAYGGGRVNRTGYTNLDCKVNPLGYTKNNLVVCCSRCNSGKSDKFSYEEWVEVGKVLKAFREQKLVYKVGAM